MMVYVIESSKSSNLEILTILKKKIHPKQNIIMQQSLKLDLDKAVKTAF